MKLKQMPYLLFLFLFCAVSFLHGQDTLLFEDFEEATISSQWKVVDNDGFQVNSAVKEYTAAWIIKEYPSDKNKHAAASTSYFKNINRADRWLISPSISLGNSDNFISWVAKSFDPSYPDSYKVLVSTTGNNLSDFTDTLYRINFETPQWNKHIESLDKYASQSIYLAFVNTTYDGYQLFIDSVYIRKNDPLSVAENSMNFSIYPNPFQDYITITSENIEIKKVILFNELGEKIVEKSNPMKKSISIPLIQIQPGIYFLNLVTSQGIVRKKIIKR